MRLRLIEFSADFPDDQLEEDGEITRPGGMTLAGAIADLLSKSGMKSSEPVLDFEHGWEFYAENGRRIYWVLVTDMGETKLVQTEDVSRIWVRIFSDHAHYDRFTDLLYEALLNDVRFSAVSRCPIR